MSYGMSPGTVAEYERRAAEAERSPIPWILRAARVIVWAVYALVLLMAILLSLAFFLRLAGANPDSGFVRWVERSANEAMEPFRGIFPTRELSGDSVFDPSLLFAAVVYFVLALLVDGVVHWLTHRLRRQEQATAGARVQADAAAQTLAAQEQAADLAARQAAAREYAAQQAVAQQYAAARAAAEEVVAERTPPPPPAPPPSPGTGS